MAVDKRRELHPTLSTEFSESLLNIPLLLLGFFLSNQGFALPPSTLLRQIKSNSEIFTPRGFLESESHSQSYSKSQFAFKWTTV